MPFHLTLMWSMSMYMTMSVQHLCGYKRDSHGGSPRLPHQTGMTHMEWNFQWPEFCFHGFEIMCHMPTVWSTLHHSLPEHWSLLAAWDLQEGTGRWTPIQVLTFSPSGSQGPKEIQFNPLFPGIGVSWGRLLSYLDCSLCRQDWTPNL